MGQSPSSVRSKSGRQRSFRGFVRRNKLNKSSLSHTFSLAPSEEGLKLMNINIATEEQLMTLPGVNRQLAQGIVSHRQMIGRFKRVDDLALVSGIGAEKLEVLRPEICVTSRKAVSRASSCTQSLDSVRINSDNRLCSVNSSSVFQLQCVPGLNQELAANIVDHRNKKGPFKSLDDLIKVRGMDIVRLSTIKAHLSLEQRKCESVQQLANGHANGWHTQLNGTNLNTATSTPKTVNHRKSLSMPNRLPITLPNGFASAPVNDILDLLAAYSHRPILEENFNYERNGHKCCRIASWNLHQMNVDKINNPGVREVICRTILENKLSILAVQDVVEEASLRLICEELNAPALRRVKEWRCNTMRWEYCLAEHESCKSLGFIYESVNKSGVTVEDIDLEQILLLVDDSAERRHLLEELAEKREEGVRVAAQAFLLNNRPLVLLNVQCEEELAGEDAAWLRRVAHLAEAAGLQLALVGEVANLDNVHELQTKYQTLLSEELQTTLDAKTMGRSVILAPTTQSNFNGTSGAIKSGLSHLAIPRGWSWGGPASPHCPVWAEYNIPD